MQRHAMKTIFAVLVILACSGVARTQTPKTPKSAGADTTAAGASPDFTGVWIANPPKKGDTPDTDEADENVWIHKPYPMQTWVATQFAYNSNPLLKNPYAPARVEMNPYLTNCDQIGPAVQWLFQTHPFRILQNPKRVMIIFERDHEVRQIWIDGRPHAKVPTSWMGDSIAHWEGGDTLVIDTVQLNNLTWLDNAGHVHSDALHLMERLQRTGDQMKLNITFDDPKAYTTQWSAFKTYHLVPKGELAEDVLCEDKYGRLGLDLEPQKHNLKTQP